MKQYYTLHSVATNRFMGSYRCSSFEEAKEYFKKRFGGFYCITDESNKCEMVKL